MPQMLCCHCCDELTARCCQRRLLLMLVLNAVCILYVRYANLMTVSTGVIDDKRFAQNLIRLTEINVNVLEVLITLIFILRKNVVKCGRHGMNLKHNSSYTCV